MNGLVTLLSEKKILRTSNELGETASWSERHEFRFARVILRNQLKTETNCYDFGFVETRTTLFPKKIRRKIFDKKKSVFDRGDNFRLYFSSRLLIINGMNTAGKISESMAITTRTVYYRKNNTLIFKTGFRGNIFKDVIWTNEEKPSAYDYKDKYVYEWIEYFKSERT